MALHKPRLRVNGSQRVFELERVEVVSPRVNSVPGPVEAQSESMRQTCIIFSAVFSDVLLWDGITQRGVSDK